MDKNTFFTGQPIFTQLLSFIPRSLIDSVTEKHQSDRYVKKFHTYTHLVTMLYSCFHGCTALREVITGMQVCSTKLGHLGIKFNPRRSTLSDANSKRTEEVFSDIYHQLYKRYYPSLPDSQKEIYIIDSTTMQLFSEIMKAAGCTAANGKRKGGMKAQVLMKADENIPQMVQLTAAAVSDKSFMKELALPAGSVIIFDKGYVNFAIFEQWTKQGITWVTRQTEHWTCNVIKVNAINDEQKKNGVLTDEQIIIGKPKAKVVKVNARRICFTDNKTKKNFTFVTNDLIMEASKVAALYKSRWKIEMLFKRMKQNFPLQYFLGDNANAIKIQFWCVLICDLLVKIVRDSLKRRWAFANIASMIRLHLMTYIDLFTFLNHPDKALLNYRPPEQSQQLSLHLT